jgi:hypothetical protein
MNGYIQVAPGIYTYLTRDELSNLRRCLKIAYPNNARESM